MSEKIIEHRMVYPFDFARTSCATYEVHVRSLEDFIRFVNTEIPKDGEYVYRGHLSSDWKLNPSLFRHLGMSQHDEAEAKALMCSQMEQFRMAARGRCNLASNVSEDEWWAFGQHLGLKTPLLDWTRSPYIALFFAFADVDEYKDCTKDRVVIVLDKGAIHRKRFDRGRELSEPETAMRFLEPFSHENPRMVSQAGLLSITPTLWSVEFMMEVEFEDEPEAKILTRLLIPDALRAEILCGLDLMNINYLSLFPDIDGAARHCNLRHDIAHVARKADSDG
jgi:hypothetical protein